MAKKRSHKFSIRVAFSKAVTKAEAIYCVRDSGQFGKGSDDYFDFYRDERMIDGEMKITAISHAKTGR